MELSGISSNREEEFVIVKNTSDNKWKHQFLDDPRIVGVTLYFSAFFSFAGKMSNIAVSYSDLDTAKEDLVKIKEYNPYGEYDICPLLR